MATKGKKAGSKKTKTVKAPAPKTAGKKPSPKK